MTAGPPRKVLAEVAATISEIPDGELTLTWSTVHDHRVVECSSTTVRYVPEATEAAQPAEAAPPQETEKTAKTAGNPVAQAFADSWRVLFPPRDHRRPS